MLKRSNKKIISLGFVVLAILGLVIVVIQAGNGTVNDVTMLLMLLSFLVYFGSITAFSIFHVEGKKKED